MIFEIKVLRDGYFQKSGFCVAPTLEMTGSKHYILQDGLHWF
jgi:hypothetical protein